MDDVSKWSSSRSKTIHFGRRHPKYEPVAEVDKVSTTTTTATTTTATFQKWKVMWKKLLREKKKMFQRSVHHNNNHAPNYDEHTYAQNFDDQGSAAYYDQPDVLSRSFSVRFADHSSTIFQRKLSSYETP